MPFVTAGKTLQPPGVVAESAIDGRRFQIAGFRIVKKPAVRMLRIVVFPAFDDVGVDVPVNNSSPHPKPQRGRPKADDRRKVADDIFAAAKRCVERKGFTEVTLREIAEEAGTEHATINYYYGSRDKLMLEIVDEAIGEALQGLRQLRDEIRANPDGATRAFLAGAQGLILRHAPAVRIFFSEIIRGDDSAIRSYYNERWSAMWTLAFGDIITTAIECGVYRQDVDADRIAFLLKGLAIYTLLKPQAMLPR